MTDREQRGQLIASVARIQKEGDFYIVPSQFNPVPTRYKVKLDDENPTCTCPDFTLRGGRCKHIYAVEYYIKREQHPDGSETVTERVTITKTRKTYPQDWPAYNAAQVNERAQFQRLLHELCKGVYTQDADAKPRRGRPAIPLQDAIFAVVYKVYSTFSGRRFVSDLCDCQSKGYVSRVPHYNSIFNYMENADLYPILLSMIERAAKPLAEVESNFAVDSTGFTACRFVRWYDVKYERFTSLQQWIKAHLMCGVKTNVVTAIEIHEQNSGDAQHMPSLVETTAKNFKLDKVSADKGYSGRANHDVVAKHGGIPFIAFKENATGGVGGLFEAMWHYFCFNRENFLDHYHQRSNVESTVMMIKTKFGDSLRSKTEAAMRNETLCKVLCHNICCLISAIYELGIEPAFGL